MKSVLYLSGAPRVSTREGAEMTGPRAHVLGMIDGFEAAGYRVDRWICGDRLPEKVGGEGGENQLSGSRAKKLAADAVRIVQSPVGAALARREFRSDHAFCYERCAAFQALGQTFRRRGVPWVLEVNGIFGVEAASVRGTVTSADMVERFQRRACRSADLVVATSQNMADQLAADFALDDDRIIVVPNGVDADRFAEAARDRSAPRGTPTLGFVGNLAPWQALGPLLEQLAKVSTPHRPLVRIAGSGSEEADLRNKIAKLGLDADVELVGRIDPADVPAFLGEVDFGYCGSQALGMGSVYFSPLKVYEYLAAGLALVISDEVPLPDVAVGRVGLSFHPGDDSLAGVLQALPSLDREAVAQLQNEARVTAVECCSWDARAGLVVDALRSRGLL